jgi:glucose/arabinose dehydrogenase
VPEVSVGQVMGTGLRVPWGVAFLPDGRALVAERPTGQIVRLDADGGPPVPVGIVPGVADQGEGGLLGLAVAAPADGVSPDAVRLFAYFTSTSGDNRVVSMRYADGRLGRPSVLLSGIPSAGNHDGGALVLGPDGMLWIGTGDAANSARAQDRRNLGGKILRILPDGGIPPDNPFAGSAVWSYGHRNVQGIAFDSRGQPWATEFGQNTWDELNRIRRGGNYGWPQAEGREGQRAGLIPPVVQWRTSEASPSGLAIVDDVAYLGALRGRRVWQVPLYGTRAGTPKALFRDEYGRIRNVVAAPDGGLWITTSNRDGRGDPGPDDDQVLALDLG